MSLRYVRLYISIGFDLHCYGLCVLMIRLARVIVIQFLALLYIVRIHQYYPHTFSLYILPRVKPLAPGRFHSHRYTFESALFGQLPGPTFKHCKSFASLWSINSLPYSTPLKLKSLELCFSTHILNSTVWHLIFSKFSLFHYRNAPV